MDRRRQLIEAILRPSAPKPGGPILDLNQVPSPDAQAGLLSGMLQNYEPGMADYARGAEGLARGMTTAAPEAIVKAYEDPSLATVSSAAGQTALTFGKPLQAAGIAGMGLLGSVLNDAGVFDTEAQAGKKAALEPAPKIPGYSPELQAAFEQAWAKKERADFKSGVDRRAAEKVVQDGLDFMAKNAEREAVSKQKEYDAKVDRAMLVRDQELARDQRFADTETGKWFEENATWLPFAAAYGGGALTRLATGPGKGAIGKAFKDWVMPIFGGGTLSYGAQNAPELYDMGQAPALNPEKEAYTKAAMELPEGHPDKQKWADYAAGLPTVNPVKTAAAESFKQNAGARGMAAALEGVSLGKIGAGTVNLPRRLINDAADARAARSARALETPNAASASPVPPAGTQSANPAGTALGQPLPKRQNYPSITPEARQDARDAYADVFSRLKSLPNPTLTANEIKSVLDRQGVNVAITPARIKATNDAVRNFTARMGRPPFGADDWSQIFNDKTLLVALGAGVGAGALAGGSGEAEAADPQRAMLIDLIRRVQAGEV